VPRTELITFSCDGWPMHGIVHLPQMDAQRRIGVIVLQGNLNSSPKFGAHWMFRRVSDALAEAGFYAFRYDDRGTCDSPGDYDLSFRDRIADLCAASRFFRRQYHLDGVIFWGLCMGAAVVVHASARLKGSEQPDGLVLCSVLAHAPDASLPEFGYRATTLSAFLRSTSTGNSWSKARRLLTDASYRRNAYECVRVLVAGYTQRSPVLQQLQADVAKVGGLLAGYDRPMLLIFGEKDPFWFSFKKYVNPDDKLGLSKKTCPPKTVVMEDGDHVFASREQMRELIESTLAWLPTLWSDKGTNLSYVESGNGLFAKPAVE